MNYNKVEISGINTAKLPVQKETENIECIRRARGGDKAAREKMIGHNLKLVLSVIKRFNNRGENLDDLFQVGCIGLIKAIDNFDLSQGVRFSTYAVPMIIGEVRRHLRDNNSVRVSRSLRDLAYKIMGVKEEFINRYQKEPTISQIAKALEVPEEDVTQALEAIVEPVSLFEPIYSDGGDHVYVMDQIGDKNDESCWIDEIAFKQAVTKLSNREKRILHMRFLNGKTQVEVSRIIGISQAQVSRLEKGAMDKIRQKQ